MKLNKWTIALAATGVVSLGTVHADEAYPVGSILSGTTLGGFVDTSAIWNFGSGAAQANRFANTAHDRQDGFNLNVVKLELEKPLDESSWAAGYRVDMMFGPDAQVMPGRLGSSDIALQQAYVALHAPVGPNGIDIKVGQFNPTIGYEMTDSYANPNFSRSFGFQSIQPLGHLGVLATYQVNDILGFNVGVANSQFGNSSGYDAAGRSTINSRYAWDGGAETWKTYMAGVVLQAPEEAGWLAGSSLYAGVVKGFAGGPDNDPVNVYVGGTMATPWEAITIGGAWNGLLNANGAALASGPSNLPMGGPGGYANAYAAYFNVAFTESLSFHGRAEYAHSNIGIFTGTTGSPNATADEQIFGYTATVDYRLWANVLSRVEFRWDRDLNGNGIFGANGQKNDFSLLLNMVYRF